MKTAALVIGIIGGVIGLIAVLPFLIASLLGTALGATSSASYIVFAGLATFAISIAAIIYATLARYNPRISGILLIIFGIAGLLLTRGFFIISGPLMILGGIFALIGYNQQKSKEILETEKKDMAA